MTTIVRNVFQIYRLSLSLDFIVSHLPASFLSAGNFFLPYSSYSAIFLTAKDLRFDVRKIPPTLLQGHDDADGTQPHDRLYGFSVDFLVAPFLNC